jgi:glycosyltransferase involved in cell wall biosynthesis
MRTNSSIEASEALESVPSGFASDRSAANLVSESPVEKRRMRILSISCAYPNAAEPGLGVFVERRLRHLAELADLEIVAPFAVMRYGNPAGKRLRLSTGGNPSGRADGGPTVMRPRWFYPPFSGSLTPLWLAAQLLAPLRRIRRQFPFDVLDTHFGHPDGIAGAVLGRLLGIPFTMTLRGNEPAHAGAGMGRRLMAWALRHAAAVFTVSERLRQFAISLGADPGKVRTVPNGVDTEVFSPKDRAASRRRHGLPLNRPLIVSAGALIERKGHHRVIEALHDIRQTGIDAELAIVGGPGPEGLFEDRLRSLSSDLGLSEPVHFLGAVPQEAMAELLSAADVVCLASSREGWPNVVHEALACGTPVVACDVGAVPDMLPSPEFGFVVPVDDRRALGQALTNGLRKTWDRPAIARWGQARNWRQVAREVLEELERVANRNRRRV